MDAQVLKTVGQVAGIGGLALGVFLLLFRDIIRKYIFPKLPVAEAYRLLRLITGAVWSVAIVGILAWVYVETREPAAHRGRAAGDTPRALPGRPGSRGSRSGRGSRASVHTGACTGPQKSGQPVTASRAGCELLGTSATRARRRHG